MVRLRCPYDQAHARNKREFGEASPFRQNFQQGGAIAAGVAAAPLAIIAAAEVGAGVGASYLSQIVRAGAGRELLRKMYAKIPGEGFLKFGLNIDW